MSVSIEIAPELDQLLTAATASQEQSTEEYALEWVLPDAIPSETPHALVAMLKSRVEAAEAGGLFTQSLDDIFDLEIRKLG